MTERSSNPSRVIRGVRIRSGSLSVERKSAGGSPVRRVPTVPPTNEVLSHLPANGGAIGLADLWEGSVERVLRQREFGRELLVDVDAEARPLV